MVIELSSCDDDSNSAMPHVESLRAAKNAHELFDRLRVWHNYIVPGSASGLAGFISGYCDAKDLPYGSFSRDMLDYVRSFLAVAGVEWDLLIERAVIHRRSQIPLAYAAADFARQIIYRDPLSCLVMESGRRAWSAANERVLGVDSLPAPSRVVIGRGTLGWWHLFFLDDDGVRFEELTRSEPESLVRWANKFLGVSPGSWKSEDPGMFNGVPNLTVSQT